MTMSAFIADVTIFTGTDQNPTPAPIITTLSGTIIEGTRLEGTIAGTGAATGTFSADFNSMSNTQSDSANITNTWSGEINGRADMKMKFSVDAGGLVSSQFGDEPVSGIFGQCEVTGSITPITSESLYGIELDLGNCTTATSTGNYSGFSIPASLANDTLVFAFAKDNVSGIGELTVAP